jgi:hypothetical protein
LHSRNGGNNGDAAALFRGQWVEGYDVDFVELALAEDLVRFIPELAPLLTSALATGRKALYEPDDSEGDAQAVEGTSKTLY